MTKGHTNITNTTSTCYKEMIDEVIYAKWAEMTKQFTDESDNEPLNAQEYCRYIQEILQ